MIPISIAKNGEGSTALLTVGNHVDEYEGRIALFDLAQTIDPQQIRGRVILVPAMNNLRSRPQNGPPRLTAAT